MFTLDLGGEMYLEPEWLKMRDRRDCDIRELLRLAFYGVLLARGLN